MSKAEEILDNCPSGATTKGYYKRKEVIQAMKEYARLQIEADRERVITECTSYIEPDCDNCGSSGRGYVVTSRHSIKNLPIKLD